MVEKTYAMVLDNVVRNICVWDGETPFEPAFPIDGVMTPVELIPLDELPPGAGNGWVMADGKWGPPADDRNGLD
jgi:hypothetical protein